MKLYECKECGTTFITPGTCTHWESYPRPFGIGDEDILVTEDCCPECESLDFEEIDWDEEDEEADE